MRAVCRPYGFLERFDPDFTPNTTDLSGRRYTYRNQTMIGHWNSAQLANAFITGGLHRPGITTPLPTCPRHCLSVHMLQHVQRASHFAIMGYAHLLS